MPQSSYGIHWFRRDLRVAGNPALQQNWKKHNGNVVGVFCFDKDFLSRSDFSHTRFVFFLNTLTELKKELQAIGSDLIFMDIGPKHAFPELFKWLAKAGRALPSHISWNRDYEPFAIARDDTMKAMFNKDGIEVLTDRDHILIEPHEIEKPSNPDSPYQVYSPYQRNWLKVFQSDHVQTRISQQKTGLKYLEERLKNKAKPLFSLTWSKVLDDKTTKKQAKLLEQYLKESMSHVNITIPEAGSLAAYSKLKSFKTNLDKYQKHRDIPSLAGTSKLSMYLKNGSITSSQIIAAFDLDGTDEKNSGRQRYLAELIWREFYYYILAKFPKVEHQAFLEKFENLPWQNREDWFNAWKDGKTGFPIVDAGMRELKATGWMHNRVRMIVASFLCKDLLIDWKWGERYFMEALLDGDLAPNNGGWQWAASTGCDPQPYFRIFNPLLQSQKFDPDGTYIKKYIPELSHLDKKAIHAPGIIDRQGKYPKPIVDHKAQREKALKMYGDASGK